MQIAESGHLAAQIEQSLLDFGFFGFPFSSIAFQPSETSACSRITHAWSARPTVRRCLRAYSSKLPPGNAYEADHLSFQLLKTHQVERVLQHDAYTAVIFPSTE